MGICAADTACEKLLKPAQVQRWLNISRSTVYRWSETGVLLSVRLPGGLVRFKREDVEAFIAYQKGMEMMEKAHAMSDPVDLLPEANRYFDQALALVPSISSEQLERVLRSER